MNGKAWYRLSGLVANSLGRAARGGFWALLVTLLGSAPAAHAQLYHVMELGPTNMFPQGQGINESGQVVWSRGMVGDIDHAFLFDAPNMRELTTPPRMEVIPGYSVEFSGDTAACDINRSGQVVGFRSMVSNCCPRAVLWDKTGVRSLNPLLGDSYSVARAINDAGQVVGYGQFAQNYQLGLRAFLFDGTSVHDLGTLPGHKNSYAYGINNQGQIVGVSLKGDQGHAFLYDAAGMHDLGALGGGNSCARAINDRGQVVGDDGLPEFGGSQAWLWENGAMRPLTGLTTAYDINNRGQVLGQGANGPVLWEQGVTRSLNQHLPPGTDLRLLIVTAINDNGQIVGVAQHQGQPNGVAVLLTPIPGPVARLSSAALAFGDQQTWQPGTPLPLTLTNDGDQPLVVTGVSIEGAQAGDFRIAADTGETSLTAGASRTFRVSFAPSDVGSRAATLVITTNAADSPHRVSLSGSLTSARLLVSPTSLSFAAQPVGTQSGDQTVSLTNTGNAPLTLTGMTLDGDQPRDFVTGSFAGFTLAPGQAGALKVRFAPTASGSRRSRLVLAHDGPSSPSVVTLAGTATAPSVGISISGLATPTRVEFGSQPLTLASAQRSITVTNNGDAPLIIQSLTVTGAQAGEFALVGDTGGSTLAAGASRTLGIQFTPKATGSRNAVLTISTNAIGSPHTVALTGTGVVPSGGSALPTGAEFAVVAVDGVATQAKRLVVSVGQSVSFQLRVKYRSGGGADVSADPNTRIFANTPVGKFTTRTVWLAKPDAAGKTLVFYGRYYSPSTRLPIIDQVTVSIRPAPVRP